MPRSSTRKLTARVIHDIIAYNHKHNWSESSVFISHIDATKIYARMCIEYAEHNSFLNLYQS